MPSFDRLANRAFVPTPPGPSTSHQIRAAGDDEREEGLGVLRDG
jgi:hypothetical protein